MCLLTVGLHANRSFMQYANSVMVRYTIYRIGLEEVRPLLEVLSQEAGIDLLECLSTVAAQQTADFSTKVWAHLLCDSDDLAMLDLC